MATIDNNSKATKQTHNMRFSGGHLRGRMARACLVAGMAIGLVGFGSGVAAASTSHHSGYSLNGNVGRPGLAGTVATAPSNNSFTVTTRSGSTLTVDVATTTTYVERGVSSPSLSNVTVGELVAVFGSTSGTTVSASEVSISAPNHGNVGRPVLAGTVETAPISNAFTVKSRNGTTTTVEVSSATTYVERGVSAPSLSNVTVGELVAVFGTISSTTVSATEVAIAQPRASIGSFATAGTVESAPVSNAFTVTTWSGSTMTVEVSSATTYVERGVSAPSLSNVTVGELVAVFGSTSGTTVNATEVAIAQPRASIVNFATAGTVESAPSNNSFTVKTWTGTVMTVDTTSATTYAECNVSNPSLSNVSVGEFVGVVGATSGTTVTATEVLIAGSQKRGLFGYGQTFSYGKGQFGGFGGFGFGHGQSGAHAQGRGSANRSGGGRN
jgi:hypothetical protein